MNICMNIFQKRVASLSEATRMLSIICRGKKSVDYF